MTTELFLFKSNNNNFSNDLLEVYKGTSGIVFRITHKDSDPRRSEKSMKFWISNEDLDLLKGVVDWRVSRQRAVSDRRCFLRDRTADRAQTVRERLSAGESRAGFLHHLPGGAASTSGFGEGAECDPRAIEPPLVAVVCGSGGPQRKPSLF